MRFASVPAWLDWQQGAHPVAVDPGLERVGEVYRRLALPRPSTVLTVGGTNGKGSVAAYLDAILTAAGYDVGLFTSPHLIRYHERIRLRGAEIDDARLLRAFGRIDEARGELSLSFFEWNALAALVAFAEAHLDVAVLEVGMGGRLDAVNVLDPDVAAVVSVGLDHCEWLGATVDQIGSEKAGIFRAGRPAIYGSRSMPPSIGRAAAHLGARLRRLGVDFDFVERPDAWDYHGAGSRRRDLPMPALAGAMQIANAATALAVLEAAEPALLVPDAAVRAGLGALRLPGRFQRVGRDPEWVLDVAHNADAAAVLAASLRATRGRGRTLAVAGILADKDVDGIAAAVAGQIDGWIATGLDGPRAMPVEELATRLARVSGRDVRQAADVASACKLAEQTAEQGDRIVVFGSFHTVGPALVYLGLGA